MTSEEIDEKIANLEELKAIFLTCGEPKEARKAGFLLTEDEVERTDKKLLPPIYILELRLGGFKLVNDLEAYVASIRRVEE